MSHEIRAWPVVAVVYDPKTPDSWSGESGGNRTATPFAWRRSWASVGPVVCQTTVFTRALRVQPSPPPLPTVIQNLAKNPRTKFARLRLLEREKKEERVGKWHGCPRPHLCSSTGYYFLFLSAL